MTHRKKILYPLLICALGTMVISCKQQDTPHVLSATAPDNGFNGQVSRCHRIYNNDPHVSCRSLQTPSCSGSRQLSCFGSLGAPGVKQASINVIKRIVERLKELESLRSSEEITEKNVALRIARTTVQLLKNLMRDPRRPIHPAAFFSTIKDYETGANLFQWGKDQNFQCRSPGLCTPKCVPEKDCERWCDRHGALMGSKEKCLKTCQKEGKVCDNACYGLFQVDPEIDNFYTHSSEEGSSLVLWEEKHILWDLEKVCGASGLDILDITGGADFCAFFYWMSQSMSGRKCEQFIEGQPLEGDVVNPCSDQDYSWSVNTFEKGHRAYVQQQKDEFAWKKKYQGFVSDNRPIFGYEHCAAQGYAGYDYRSSQSLMVPTKALKTSVLEYGCEIGVVPPWASPEECP